MVRRGEAGDNERGRSGVEERIFMVTNWFEELRERMGN